MLSNFGFLIVESLLAVPGDVSFGLTVHHCPTGGQLRLCSHSSISFPSHALCLFPFLPSGLVSLVISDFQKINSQGIFVKLV